tara:strand:+ start:606 stop:1307 length:702 start_codon:yes stop_codon:yes gene_type:complete
MHEDIIDEISEDPNDLLTPEEIDERRKKRRYILYAVMGSILVIVVLIVAFANSQSNKEQVLDSESTDPNVPHPIVEMAKIKSVPLQGYNVTTPLIANTPQELMFYLRPAGWSFSADDFSKPGMSKTFSCDDCTGEKIVNVWIRIYNNNQLGREELFNTLETAKKDNRSIVSEISEMGSGGFIVNDNSTITYWFYYEPNIVARVDMFQAKQGTLTETKEWAHRLNYSIWSVVGR